MPQTQHRVPAAIARKYCVFLLSDHGDCLHLAVPNPSDHETLDLLSFLLDAKIKPIKTSYSDIQSLIDQHYSDSPPPPTQVREPNTTFETPTDSIETQAKALIQDAISQNTSDIHIEPTNTGHRIRFRIDGNLVNHKDIPSKLGKQLITYLKLSAHLPLDKAQHPLDGRISQDSLDLRLSILPALLGESIAIRILNPISINDLELISIGMSQAHQEQLTQLLNLTEGLILFAGPTGSGKTTSLYASAQILLQQGKKIISVEDPVECDLPGISQIPINPNHGLNFPTALKSVLRQSPDVILIGEIRDPETAKIACQAALTGHLVLSTIHTNNALSSITRLLNLDVPKYLVKNALRAVFAQRLVRKLTPDGSLSGRIGLYECFLPTQDTDFSSSRIQNTHFEPISIDAKAKLSAGLTSEAELQAIGLL